MKTRILTLATLFSLALIPLHADVIVENFDYGDESGQLTTFGSAGDGWGGGWTGATSPDYIHDTNLSYSNVGYSNLNNDATTGSAAGLASAGNIALREFASGLDGTVWFSALANMSDTSDDLLFWLSGDATTSNFVSIRSNNATIRVAGSDSPVAGTFTNNTTMLWLARATMDAGGDDTLDFWINPDLSGGEGGLGTPLLSSTGQMGATMIGVGISGNSGNNLLDAIRVSNDPNGFELVTIPEPSTLILLGIALGTLTLFRRRKT